MELHRVIASVDDVGSGRNPALESSKNSECGVHDGSLGITPLPKGVVEETLCGSLLGPLSLLVARARLCRLMWLLQSSMVSIMPSFRRKVPCVRTCFISFLFIMVMDV